MKLRIAGVIAAIFLGGAWAMAQAPTAPPPGPPIVNGGPGPAAALPGGPVLSPAPMAPVSPGADLSGSPALPAEAFNGAAIGGQFWTRAEYLLWRLRPANLPSVVEATPAGVILPLSTVSVVQDNTGATPSSTPPP